LPFNYLISQLWAKPSGLAFQIKPYSGATNIGISHTYIDGPYNSLGSGMSPTPYSNGYSFLKLDRAEPWKLRNSSPGQGVHNSYLVEIIRLFKS